MSELSTYAVYLQNPADNVATGDYHHMYVVAGNPQAAQGFAYSKAVVDGGSNTGAWFDENIAVVVMFDLAPADAECGVTQATQWNPEPAAATAAPEPGHSIAAEDAPIGVLLVHSVSSPNKAPHFTLMRVETVRTATRSYVRWIYQSGQERTFDLGQMVTIEQPATQSTPDDSAEDDGYAKRSDGTSTKPARTCKYCGIVIEREGDRWVSTQVDGTYDQCIVNSGDPTEYPAAGHRPA